MAEVAGRAKELNEPIPLPTLSRIEQGYLDPGVRRFAILLRLYGLEAETVTRQVRQEIREGAVPDLPAEELLLEARKFRTSGNTPMFLEWAEAAREKALKEPGGRVVAQRALLGLASAARGAGQMHYALERINQLLCEPPDDSLRIDALIVAASIWHELGALEVAEALLAQAWKHAEHADERRRGYYYQTRAKLHVAAKRFQDAEQDVALALACYERAGDSYHVARARLTRIAVLATSGRIEEAVEWARESVRYAHEHDHGAVGLHAQLELGRVLLEAGRPAEAVDELRRAHASAITLDDASAEFHATFRMHKALMALGEERKAAQALERAIQLARRLDDRSAEVVEALGSPGGLARANRRVQ